jgi:hypothetical protein
LLADVAERLVECADLELVTRFLPCAADAEPTIGIELMPSSAEPRAFPARPLSCAELRVGPVSGGRRCCKAPRAFLRSVKQAQR